MAPAVLLTPRGPTTRKRGPDGTEQFSASCARRVPRVSRVLPARGRGVPSLRRIRLPVPQVLRWVRRTFGQAFGGGQSAHGSQEPAIQGPADVVPSLPPRTPLRRRRLVLPGKDGRLVRPSSSLRMEDVPLLLGHQLRGSVELYKPL